MVVRRAVRVLIVSLLFAATSTAAEPPGAFELLERIRSAYAGLDAYQDLGEIETTTLRRGVEDKSLIFFETKKARDGRFQWRTHGETREGFEERLLWSDGSSAWIYRSHFEQYKAVPSVAGELVHGFGAGGYEALVVPLLLAGVDEGLADPEAAAVEGPEPCGDASCWALSLSRMGGTIESDLRVDRATHMIREITARIRDPGRAADGGERLTLTVRHYPGSPVTAGFEPPAGAREVVDWESSPPVAGGDVEDPWLDIGLHEEITVALLAVAARIVDSHGRPLLDLEPEDLIVRVGDTELPVQSLEWSSSYRSDVDLPRRSSAEGGASAGASDTALAREPVGVTGRLVVLFLQVDLQPTRVKGHLKILPDVEELLGSLHPDDRVAIVSFDSHLKLWQDFTRDRGATFETLESAIGYGRPLARPSRGLSLAEHFDFRAAADAGSPEEALQLTAEALAPLPGEKDLIYLGWGLGRYGAGGVRMTPDYEPAVRALDDARVTVFVLDVSQADAHSLEVGLQNVAAHTGGTYERTFHFASQAVRRLARTLGGHYQLTIDRSDLPEARGRLRIELRKRDGRVLFRPMILG